MGRHMYILVYMIKYINSGLSEGSFPGIGLYKDDKTNYRINSIISFGVTADAGWDLSQRTLNRFNLIATMILCPTTMSDFE
jgi:hypothetical protein